MKSCADEGFKSLRENSLKPHKTSTSGRVPHVRPSVHGPKTDSSNAFTPWADSCSWPHFRCIATALKGPTFFSPCTLGRTWGTRPGRSASSFPPTPATPINSASVATPTCFPALRPQDQFSWYIDTRASPAPANLDSSEVQPSYGTHFHGD
jgi:hypothetical protein